MREEDESNIRGGCTDMDLYETKPDEQSGISEFVISCHKCKSRRTCNTCLSCVYHSPEHLKSPMTVPLPLICHTCFKSCQRKVKL